MSQNNELSQSPQSSLRESSIIEKLMTITALSGEFPFNGLHRLSASYNYSKQLRHRLYSEDKIKLVDKDGLKGLVLTNKAMDKSKTEYPDRFKYVSDKMKTELLTLPCL